MKAIDVSKKSREELEKMLVESRKQLMLLKSASIGGEDAMKKKGRQKTVKKTIARILTRLNNE